MLSLLKRIQMTFLKKLANFAKRNQSLFSKVNQREII